MHEHINEKISQFVDDELDADQALTLLQQLRFNDELKNKLQRYQAISHAVKAETYIAPRADFLDRIHQDLEHEPVYLLPQRKATSSIKPQHKILALVASAALVAVILPKDVTSLHSPQIKASAGLTLAQRQPRMSENVIKQKPNALPLNAQINDYMRTHDKTTEDNNETAVAPIVETTAYTEK